MNRRLTRRCSEPLAAPRWPAHNTFTKYARVKIIAASIYFPVRCHSRANILLMTPTDLLKLSLNEPEGDGEYSTKKAKRP